MRYNPLLGSDMSGHVGGVVASHNTYGVYLKRRAHPVNPRSAGQVLQRSALQFVSQSWRGLDPSVQDTWRSIPISKKSRKGFVVTLTGQAYFMYVNTMRRRIGLSLIESPPLGDDVAEFTLPSVSLVLPTTASITFAPGDPWNLADGGVIVSAGGPLSPGQSYYQKFLTVGVHAGPMAAAVDFTLPFAVGSGDRVRFRFHATDPAGRQSIPATLDVTAP